MLFSLLMFLLVLGVAYWHYIQGVFSATISAILAIVAASVAIGFHEPLVDAMASGKFNDQAHAICLVSLFAGTYILLRLLFDWLVPGNVTVPVMADRVGGALMGLVAGVFCVGIIAIAGQSLPFGTTLMGFARYEVKNDRDVSISPGENQRSIDRRVLSELVADDFDPGKRNALLLPVDAWTLGVVSHLSDGGALDNGRPLKSVHPDYLQELFGQRLGLQPAAKHTVSNSKGTQVSLAGTFIGTQIAQKDFEVKEIRNDRALPAILKAEPDKVLVFVRAEFRLDSSDEDKKVRLAPGAVRLVAKGQDGTWQNYFPIGTVDGAATLYNNKIDDTLFVDLEKGDRTVDFAFLVDRAAFFADGAGKKLDIAKGVFVEIKRLERFTLEAQAKSPYTASSKGDGVMRKWSVGKPVVAGGGGTTGGGERPPTPPPGGGGEGPAAGGFAASGLDETTIVGKRDGPLGFRVGTDGSIPGVTAEARGGKIERLEIDSPVELAKLAAAGSPAEEMFVMLGKRIVQVTLKPRAGGDSWMWAGMAHEMQIFDSKGSAIAPSGVIARVTGDGGVEKVMGRFSAGGTLSGGLRKGDGAVTSVTFVYVLASDASGKELRFRGAFQKLTK